MAATVGVRPYIQSRDKLVFVSLDEEAHANFAALLPILLGHDSSYSQWQTKYYTAYLTWHLPPPVEADLLFSFAASDDTVTLYVIGFSSQLSSDSTQQLEQALNTSLPVLLIYFQPFEDDNLLLPDLELSLDQELLTIKLPQEPLMSADQRQAYWSVEVEQAMKPLALAARHAEGDDSQGMRALIEYLDVFDWKSKDSRMRKPINTTETSEIHAENADDVNEESLANLEKILSEIEEARAKALSGCVSDQERRERAATLFSQLMTALDLGNLDV